MAVSYPDKMDSIVPIIPLGRLLPKPFCHCCSLGMQAVSRIATQYPASAKTARKGGFLAPSVSMRSRSRRLSRSKLRLDLFDIRSLVHIL